MTPNEVREIFDQSIATEMSKPDPNWDRVDNLKMIREFMFNLKFRKSFSDYIWEINQEKS